MPIATDTRRRSPKVSTPPLIPAVLQVMAAMAGLAAAVASVRLARRAVESGSIGTVLVLVAGFLIVIALLWAIFRLGRLIRRGEALSPTSVALLSRISLLTAVLGVVRAGAGPWLVTSLGLAQPRLSSPPGLPDLILLMLCGVVFCTARAMAEGVRLADEDAHIV